jgi:hypothetical protein
MRTSRVLLFVFILLSINSIPDAFATAVTLPNLNLSATGTAGVGAEAGHYGLDTNIISPITVLNPSDGPTGAPVPPDANYIGGQDASGNLKGFLFGPQVMTNSLSVSVASDQTPLPTLSPVNTNGSASNSTSVGTGAAVTFAPPANCIGFIAEADDTNSGNMRWAVGTTATSTTGIIMEAGRDTGMVPVCAPVTFIALIGTQAVGVQWILSH